jgi:hypothetical protein
MSELRSRAAFRVAASVIAGSIAISSTTALAGPAEICRSSQLKAAGKACSGALKCYAKAAKSGDAIDSDCLETSRLKLVNGLDKFALKGGCDFPDLDPEAWLRVTELAEDVAVDELAYQTGGVCASTKLKASAKKCMAFLKCYSAAAKSSTPFAPAPECLSTASGKFDSAFAKADSKYVCTPPDRHVEVEALIDDAAAELSVLATSGPGATTTTSTTSTTMDDNTAPSISSVLLTPAVAYAPTMMTCTPQGPFDGEGDVINYAYAWTVNGSPVATTNPTPPAYSFLKHDQVSCTVTPSDIYSGDGTPVTSNTVTVQNSPPDAGTTTLTPSPSPATETSTLFCYAGGGNDADAADSPTVARSWTVNGNPIAATTFTINGSAFSKGDSVQCTATYSDGEATSEGPSNVVTIESTPPSITSVSISPATAFETSTLTCVAAGWSDIDGDPEGYTYSWSVNGSPVAPTTSTLTGTYFSKGNSVTCTATPFDGSVSGSAVTSSARTIQNTAPTLTSASVTPSTAYTNTTLTCTPSGAADVDGDSVTFTYVWRKQGIVIGGQTASTLAGSSFNKNDFISCSATPTDGTASGSQVTSSAVFIQNSAPVTNSVSLTPTTAFESSTLTCTPSSTDADGDTVTYTYFWEVNGNGTSQHTSTLNGTYFNAGDTVQCYVFPDDGSESGLPVTSNIVTIQ